MDVKFLIKVDADGAIKSTKEFDGEIKNMPESAGKAEKAHKSLIGQIALGALAYKAATGALRFMKDAVKDSLAAFMEQEKVDKALSASLEITGRPVKALTEHFKAMASAIQKETIYGDEAIQGAQTLLIQLTDLDKKGLDRATKGVVGFASVMGMDLTAASNLVAKAMSGQVAALGRYGIQIDSTKSKEEQRIQVLDKLEQFYGRATAETETYSGKLAQLKNVYGDLQEKVGKYIVENTGLLATINNLIDLTEWLMTTTKTNAEIEHETSQGISAGYVERRDKLLSLGVTYAEFSIAMQDFSRDATGAIVDEGIAFEQLLQAVRKGDAYYVHLKDAVERFATGQRAAANAEGTRQAALKKLRDEIEKNTKGTNAAADAAEVLEKAQKEAAAAIKVATEVSLKHAEAIYKDIDAESKLIVQTGRMTLIEGGLSKQLRLTGEIFQQLSGDASTYEDIMASLGDTESIAAMEAKRLAAAKNAVSLALVGCENNVDKMIKAYKALDKASAQAAKEMPKDWQVALNRFVAKWERSIMQVQQILNALDGLFAASYAKKQALIDADYAKTTSKLDKEYNAKIAALNAIDAAEAYQNQRREIMNSNMTEAEKQAALESLETQRAKDAARTQLDLEYATKKEAAEAEYAAKSEAARIAAAKKQKAIAYAQAVINTALGVAQALGGSAPPMNFILAALTAIMGGIQIATIASTPLAKGAIFSKPTILPGMNGQSYEVAESGSGGVEIVATPKNIWEAVSKYGGSGHGTTVIHNYIYLDGKLMKEFINKAITDDAQTGRLSIPRKAVA